MNIGDDMNLDVNFDMSPSFFNLDHVSYEDMISRSTHIGIAAHHDDLEIMAFHAISQCFESQDLSFLGIILTDGANSPRTNEYRNTRNSEMIELRKKEQIEACRRGKYGGIIFLNLTSDQVKKNDPRLRQNLKQIVRLAKPLEIILHNPFDFHPTHRASFFYTLETLESFQPSIEKSTIIASEVWGSLEWLPKQYRIIMDTSGSKNLAHDLLSCFSSQIQGGKNYLEATLGRRISNATFHHFDATDERYSMNFGLNMNLYFKAHPQKIKDFLEDILETHKNQTLDELNSFFS
jgi:LmbE family N-acetylglucosaminyl deacetylase